jgi:hypothetical protein
MEKEFRFFDLGPASRLAIAGGSYALGSAIQLALPGWIVPGLLVTAAGWIPLMLRRATNKPDDQGLEEWRPVTIAELDRLDDTLRESKKIRKKARPMGRNVMIAMLAPIALFTLIGGVAAGGTDFVFVAGNALIFLVPALFFGGVKVFLPKDIDMKMPSFRAVLARPLPKNVAVAPYIRFDKDPKGRDVPEDLRIMLEMKRPPEDLVGVQLQAAINNGPNGPVPYLYAVVLTRGRNGQAYSLASRVSARGFEVEAGGDDSYGTVIMRQDTSGGGYHTTPDDCRELLELCLKVLERMGAAA